MRDAALAIAGVALLALSATLIRHRAAIAAWQLRQRLAMYRRSSLLNQDRVDRQAEAFQTGDSLRLERWMVTWLGTIVGLLGVGLIARAVAGA